MVPTVTLNNKIVTWTPAKLILLERERERERERGERDEDREREREREKGRERKRNGNMLGYWIRLAHTKLAADLQYVQHDEKHLHLVSNLQ